MLPDVATDVATYLAGAGLGLTLGQNLFVASEIADGPAPAVYVELSGGPQPRPYLGTGRSFHELAVRILVRGSREKKQESASLARDIASALHLAEIEGYVGVYLRDAQPIYLGTDDHDAPGWSVGIECHYRS